MSDENAPLTLAAEIEKIGHCFAHEIFLGGFDKEIQLLGHAPLLVVCQLPLLAFALRHFRLCNTSQKETAPLSTNSNICQQADDQSLKQSIRFRFILLTVCVDAPQRALTFYHYFKSIIT